MCVVPMRKMGKHKYPWGNVCGLPVDHKGPHMSAYGLWKRQHPGS